MFDEEGGKSSGHHLSPDFALGFRPTSLPLFLSTASMPSAPPSRAHSPLPRASSELWQGEAPATGRPRQADLPLRQAPSSSTSSSPSSDEPLYIHEAAEAISATHLPSNPPRPSSFNHPALQEVDFAPSNDPLASHPPRSASTSSLPPPPKETRFSSQVEVLKTNAIFGLDEPQSYLEKTEEEKERGGES